MNLFHSTILRAPAAMLAFAIALALPISASADPDAAISAKELASRLSSRQEGSAYIRLRMEIQQPGEAGRATLQIQVKERRSRGNADIAYQVIWPKDRKGEALLLHKSAGRPASGTIFMPPDKLKTLGPSQMSETIFGSNLSYEDVIDDFFAWDSQTLAGNENVNGVNCAILESRPGKGEHSQYTSVRSWIDPRRLVPLKVEKYSGQRVIRHIETTRVASDDKGRPIPANLTIRGGREDSVTEIDGSKIKHDVSFSDREFTPEGLKEVSPPRAEPE